MLWLPAGPAGSGCDADLIDDPRLTRVLEEGDEIGGIGKHRSVRLLKQRIGGLPLHAGDVGRPGSAQDFAVIAQSIDESGRGKLGLAFVVEPARTVGKNEGRQGIDRLHAITARHKTRNVGLGIVERLRRRHQLVERLRRLQLLRSQHRLVIEEGLQFDRDRDADLLAICLVCVQDVGEVVGEIPIRGGQVGVDVFVERLVPAGPRERGHIPGRQGEEAVDRARVGAQEQRQLLAQLVFVDDLPIDLDAGCLREVGELLLGPGGPGMHRQHETQFGATEAFPVEPGCACPPVEGDEGSGCCGEAQHIAPCVGGGHLSSRNSTSAGRAVHLPWSWAA